MLRQHLKHTEVDMANDLSPRWENFAVYLPAMQYHYANAVNNTKPIKNREFPADLKMSDLDFLNPKSKLWHYKYALYSAGQFNDASPKACCVSNRDKENTIILGDSGGYQIGKGTLKGTEHFKKAKSALAVCEMWRDSKDVRKRIVHWLEANSDYAMTIDMPLWARTEANKNTPFHKCSVEQLIELSVENLEYIKRYSNGSTKWLNVLQGETAKDTKQWWDAVKKYKLSGWAFGGNVGVAGGLGRMLECVLTMRDDNGFDEGLDWAHVLGVSQPTWAVLLTAIQSSLRKKCRNPKLRFSYDSASPFQAAGIRQQVVRYPKFTKDIGSWVMSAHEAPVNPIYAGKKGAQYRFPYPSPIGDLLTLNHLNVRGGEFQRGAYDTVSNHILTNHNVWVYVRSFLEANELAFMHSSEADKAVPQKLIDACAFIEYIIGEENWEAKLKKEQKLLADLFSKAMPKDIAILDEVR